MKYIQFIIIFLFSVLSFGQDTEADTDKFVNIIGVGHELTGYPTLHYIAKKKKKKYTFIFKNEEYVQADDIKFFYFLSKDTSLNDFYNFLVEAFDKDQETQLSIGDVTVIAQKVHSSIKITVKYPDQASGWFKIKKRPLDKLFGKL